MSRSLQQKTVLAALSLGILALCSCQAGLPRGDKALGEARALADKVSTAFISDCGCSLTETPGEKPELSPAEQMADFSSLTALFAAFNSLNRLCPERDYSDKTIDLMAENLDKYFDTDKRPFAYQQRPREQGSFGRDTWDNILAGYAFVDLAELASRDNYLWKAEEILSSLSGGDNKAEAGLGFLAARLFQANQNSRYLEQAVSLFGKAPDFPTALLLYEIMGEGKYLDEAKKLAPAWSKDTGRAVPLLPYLLTLNSFGKCGVDPDAICKAALSPLGKDPDGLYYQGSKSAPRDLGVQATTLSSLCSLASR